MHDLYLVFWGGESIGGVKNAYKWRFQLSPGPLIYLTPMGGQIFKFIFLLFWLQILIPLKKWLHKLVFFLKNSDGNLVKKAKNL